MPVNKEKAEEERLEILRKYRRLIEVWHTRKETSDRWMVRKAFRVAADAHKDMRRKTGEPFIYHPLEVATIAAGEIGLGRTSIISALLHDTVEDTDLTLKDIVVMFDEEVAKIIDGLTKIDEISDGNTTAQSETLKKIILTLSEDVRVILIKLSDRLHNMRTMDIMTREKQMKIASETQYIYAPLANRLGLYKIKSELEDLSFKYLQPDVYTNIKKQIEKVTESKLEFYDEFTKPIEDRLNNLKLDFKVQRNVHSVYSIWRKMKKSELSIKEIRDTESIDIIIDSDLDSEKLNCWAAYSIITSVYKPNSKRLRDWISTPKANGYEAIHTTVMSKTGQWVDVHIRSKRMDEIASKGYAAHWKYKNGSQAEIGLDHWLSRTRELISDESNDETINFINDFQSNLFSDEIIVFTPKGDVKSLPLGSTVLDYAYSIHSDLGNHCLGATINHKLVSLDYVLKTGDQVKVLDSKNVNPTTDWYKYVSTARSKSKIKLAIKNERKKHKEKGEEKLREYFEQLNIQYSKVNIAVLMELFKLKSPLDLFYFVDENKITLKDIKESFPTGEGWSNWLRKNLRIPYLNTRNAAPKEAIDKVEIDKKEDTNDIDDKLQSPDYTVEKCCNPIPGDAVIGLYFPGEPIQVHRTGCGRATQLMSHYGKNIVKTKWKQKEGITFLASLKIKAVDKMGLLSKLTLVASNDMKVNIRSMYLRSSEGLTDIGLSIYVPDTQVLKRLIKKLKKINEVIKINRVDNLDDFV